MYVMKVDVEGLYVKGPCIFGKKSSFYETALDVVYKGPLMGWLRIVSSFHSGEATVEWLHLVGSLK